MKLLIYSVFILTAGIIYSGCSPSSNSVRYNENSKEEKEKPHSTRFSSEDDIKKSSIDTSFNAYDNSDGEDLPLEKNTIDVSRLITTNSSVESGEFTTVKEKMLMEIIKYLNTPYKFGGTTKNGIDCSAFTQTIYRECISIPLLRTAHDQYAEGTPVESVSDLKFGDLVFFDTRRNVKPGHVGIYLGDDLFAHASSKQGVTVSSIDLGYYSKRFMGGRRIEELYGSSSLSK